MKASAQSKGLWLLLGLGTVDLAALNLWVLPSLLVPAAIASPERDSQTVWLAATERARLPPAASEPEPAFAAARAADPASPPAPAVSAEPSPRTALAQTPTAVLPERAQPSSDARTVIIFGKGTWWVGPSSRALLTALVARLEPDAAIEIDGYADASGPDPLNERISRARAEAIADQLVLAGLDRARLVLHAHGELPASSEDDGHRDRRAELRVVRRQP